MSVKVIPVSLTSCRTLVIPIFDINYLLILLFSRTLSPTPPSMGKSKTPPTSSQPAKKKAKKNEEPPLNPIVFTHPKTKVAMTREQINDMSTANFKFATTRQDNCKYYVPLQAAEQIFGQGEAQATVCYFITIFLSFLPLFLFTSSFSPLPPFITLLSASM